MPDASDTSTDFELLLYADCSIELYIVLLKRKRDSMINENSHLLNGIEIGLEH